MIKVRRLGSQKVEEGPRDEAEPVASLLRVEDGTRPLEDRRERRLARARGIHLRIAVLSTTMGDDIKIDGQLFWERLSKLHKEWLVRTFLSLSLSAPPLRRRTIKSALSPLSHPRRKRATRTACTRARTRSSSIRARTTMRPSTPSPSRSRRGCSATSLPRRSYSSARARSTSSRPRRRCRSWSR